MSASGVTQIKLFVNIKPYGGSYTGWTQVNPTNLDFYPADLYAFDLDTDYFPSDFESYKIKWGFFTKDGQTELDFQVIEVLMEPSAEILIASNW